MKVYFDNSATTKMNSIVVEKMETYLNNIYANPSSIYSIGQKSKKLIDESRINVAKLVNAEESEIFFTSSGSESNSWAILGTAFANMHKGKHIITSKIEHKSILNSMKYLEERFGFEVTYLNVDKEGLISINDLKKSIKNDTILISIMYVNNEIGSIQNINQISFIANTNNIIFHSDFVQAISSIKIDVKSLNVDLVSISSHKVYGPKGIGALYIKKGTNIDNLIFGGEQEMKKRGGTENLISIIGFGEACRILKENIDLYIEKLHLLKTYFLEKLKEFKDIHIPINPNNLTLNIIPLIFSNINSDLLLIKLDLHQIFVSNGSACNAGVSAPSEIIRAIGVEDKFIKNYIRVSFSYTNTYDEIDYFFEKLSTILNK